MADTSELMDRHRRVVSESMQILEFPFALDSQNGTTRTDVDGNDYVDFMSAWSVANLGYRHPAVLANLEAQMEKAVINSALTFVHEPVIELAERLIALAPGSFPSKVWFGHSGSEAGDFVARALPAKGDGDTIVTFEGSYHGGTQGSAAISGHTAQQSIESDNVCTVPFPNAYRSDYGAAELTERALEETKVAFESNDVAGLVTEPLQSDSGILVPPEGFLAGLADLCADNDAYFVVDEVKAGLGRTGELFAFEHDGVVPDAIVLGKPLGSGLPISAVVGRAELVDYEPASHMMTTAASPLAAVAALATLDVIETEALAARAAGLGGRLADQLDDLTDRAVIGDARGRGLMQGLEIVTPESTAPDADLTARITLRAQQLGLLVGYLGTNSNVFEITPPLTISEAELDRGVELLSQAITDARAGAVDEDLVAEYAGW